MDRSTGNLWTVGMLDVWASKVCVVHEELGDRSDIARTAVLLDVDGVDLGCLCGQITRFHNFGVVQISPDDSPRRSYAAVCVGRRGDGYGGSSLTYSLGQVLTASVCIGDLAQEYERLVCRVGRAHKGCRCSCVHCEVLREGRCLETGVAFVSLPAVACFWSESVGVVRTFPWWRFFKLDISTARVQQCDAPDREFMGVAYVFDGRQRNDFGPGDASQSRGPGGRDNAVRHISDYMREGANDTD